MVLPLAHMLAVWLLGAVVAAAAALEFDVRAGSANLRGECRPPPAPHTLSCLCEPMASLPVDVVVATVVCQAARTTSSFRRRAHPRCVMSSRRPVVFAALSRGPRFCCMQGVDTSSAPIPAGTYTVGTTTQRFGHC